jgi:hypothetical protein
MGRKFTSHLFKGFTMLSQFVEPEKYLIWSNMKLSPYSSIRSLSVEIEVAAFKTNDGGYPLCSALLEKVD